MLINLLLLHPDLSVEWTTAMLDMYYILARIRRCFQRLTACGATTQLQQIFSSQRRGQERTVAEMTSAMLALGNLLFQDTRNPLFFTIECVCEKRHGNGDVCGGCRSSSDV